MFRSELGLFRSELPSLVFDPDFLCKAMLSLLSGASLGRAPSEVETNDLTRCLVATLYPVSAASEAYRNLRTNLLYPSAANPPKVIVVTSPGHGEGKSTTCANLGVVLAQLAKRTLIMDCHFRRPSVHRFFGLGNAQGLMDVLVRERDLQEVWKEPQEKLKVLPAGDMAPNSAEILGSWRFSQFLTDMRREFDYVLIDTPPIGIVSDSVILAAQGDGVVLVLDAQKTRKGAVRQAMRSLESVGANLLGTVMNNVRGRR